MSVEFLEAERTELDQALECYDAQQINVGVQFLNEFDASIERILRYPESYVLISPNIRRCLVKRFPYGIWYGIDAYKIINMAVARLHRNPNYWADRA